MRVSGGRARGIPLRVPRGADFRPATDRLRQGVFSSLGSRIEGAWFLDLFAGTGSYGLEAFSRGAAGGEFVERNADAVAALRANIAAVCKSMGVLSANLKVSASDVVAWRPTVERPFDVVFADPPFDDIAAVAATVFERVRAVIRDGEPAGILVLEMPGELELTPPGWRLVRRIGRGRGQPTCCLYQASGS